MGASLTHFTDQQPTHTYTHTHTERTSSEKRNTLQDHEDHCSEGAGGSVVCADCCLCRDRTHERLHSREDCWQVVQCWSRYQFSMVCIIQVWNEDGHCQICPNYWRRSGSDVLQPES